MDESRLLETHFELHLDQFFQPNQSTSNQYRFCFLLNHLAHRKVLPSQHHLEEVARLFHCLHRRRNHCLQCPLVQICYGLFQDYHYQNCHLYHRFILLWLPFERSGELLSSKVNVIFLPCC